MKTTTAETKTVYKAFAMWNFEKEEEWLNGMAQDGWALKKVGYCKYVFERSEPGGNCDKRRKVGINMGKLSHLDELEAEAIYIIREVAAECEKPVMLYSIGKDSSVMLHLALKAFYPEKPPFPFLHVNTTWKFKEMIEFRDKTAKKYGLDMIEYIYARFRP